MPQSDQPTSCATSRATSSALRPVSVASALRSSAALCAGSTYSFPSFVRNHIQYCSESGDRVKSTAATTVQLGNFLVQIAEFPDCAGFSRNG
jgi:hypothetical protein